jgi:hypothetical protein
MPWRMDARLLARGIQSWPRLSSWSAGCTLAVARSLPRYPGQLKKCKIRSLYFENIVLALLNTNKIRMGQQDELKKVLIFYSLQQCSVSDVLFLEVWRLCLHHRLNMELDLQSLFGLLWTAVWTHWLRPCNPPPPLSRIWAHMRRRYWSARLPYTLNVLHEGLKRSKHILTLDKEKFAFHSTCNFFPIFGHQKPGFGPWFTKELGFGNGK